MLLPRILAPLRASPHTPSITSSPSIRILDLLRLANGSSAHRAAAPPTLSFIRHATHQAQGRANGAKDGPGKRLGAKKAGGEYVVPGNIIFRQRGTTWFPGENCKFGRDHCVFATEAGYVRYYRDPLKHPKRQYIGVVLRKEDSLPYAPHAARRRRLHYEPVLQEKTLTAVEGESSLGINIAPQVPSGAPTAKGYSHRIANWEIGRVAEKANVQVKEFIPGNRWAAWRKSQARIKAGIEKRKLRNAGKKSAKPRQRKR